MDSFKETDEEIEVRREDQERINEFGVLHRLVQDLGEDKKALQEQLNYIEDAEQEVMLAGDQQSFLVAVGSTYVPVDEGEFNSFIEKKRSVYEKKLKFVSTQAEQFEKRKAELKTVLYARFGKSINLDD
jgi:chaperonin cofactor prefoldin